MDTREREMMAVLLDMNDEYTRELIQNYIYSIDIDSITDKKKNKRAAIKSYGKYLATQKAISLISDIINDTDPNKQPIET